MFRCKNSMIIIGLGFSIVSIGSFLIMQSENNDNDENEDKTETYIKEKIDGLNNSIINIKKKLEEIQYILDKKKE